ncbi:hypothetical protein ACHHYP_02028 [Achlya hypogyna]|uniref:Uncharacterized protein n=1 Tax=Achlya hypogyna TaxID=1202772 RepID=A0A1V9ZSM9_ACHHY|nr:hypothetical protein ACHHYP_02028 [Achlya hypogyna]
MNQELTSRNDDRAIYRMNNMLKQRRFRAKYVAERALVEAELKTLTDALANASRTRSAASPSTALSWKEVAATFGSAAVVASSENKRLRAAYARRGRIVEAMKAWVASQLASTPRDTEYKRWHLLADEAIRRLGFDWITKRWYHNTDRMLAKYGFPNDSRQRFVDFNVDVNKDDTFNLVWRIQRDIPLPFETVYTRLRGRIRSLFRGDMYEDMFTLIDEEAIFTSEKFSHLCLLATVDPTMLYRYNYERVEGEHSMFLSREFYTDDRVVFVGGSVQDDEKIASNDLWHHRTFWYTLDRLSSTRTRLRVLGWHSNVFTKARGFTLEDEVTEWGVTLGGASDDVEFEKLRRVMFMRCPQAIQERDRYLSIE